jgi:hypothetical protein
MRVKFYGTNWVPELGRYVIITAALQLPPKVFAAEAFVFALDEEPFFSGQRLTYAYDPNVDKWHPVDEAYMHKEALGQAKNLIHLQMAKAYKKTKNAEIYKRDLETQEYDLRFSLFGQLRAKYEAKLIELKKHSLSEDLRRVISDFLTYSNAIRVEPFEY